jgi:hypothetical protein
LCFYARWRVRRKRGQSVNVPDGLRLHRRRQVCPQGGRRWGVQPRALDFRIRPGSLFSRAVSKGPAGPAWHGQGGDARWAATQIPVGKSTSRTVTYKRHRIFAGRPVHPPNLAFACAPTRGHGSIEEIDASAHRSCAVGRRHSASCPSGSLRLDASYRDPFSCAPLLRGGSQRRRPLPAALSSARRVLLPRPS